MKRLYYFLKNYIIDIITALVGILGVGLAWRYGTTTAMQQSISLVVVVLTLLAIIYFRSRERGFVFSPLTLPRDKNFWLGYGVFQLARVQNAFEITNADPGYIHSRVLTWSDYKLTFDFKIAKYGLGIIVRAVNLANYVMMQIHETGINPHIRINGGWNVWQAKDVNLLFENPLRFGNWYKCEIYCDKDTIAVKIFSNREKVFERFWEIPRGTLIFSYKHSEEHQTVNIPFPITLEYGSIGFREYGDEKAYVKNVLVEKL